MKRYLPTLTVATLIVMGTYAHGVRTNRWSNSRALAEASERLRTLAPNVADWQSGPYEFNEVQAIRAGITASISYRFEDSASNAMTVFFACGPAGPMSLHTPEGCYKSAGYILANTPSRLKITTNAGETAEFWSASFTSTRSLSSQLKIYWSWLGGNGWEAAKNPRLQFAGLPCLHKLYVIRPLTGPLTAQDDERDQGFLRRLLPALSPGLVLSQ